MSNTIEDIGFSMQIKTDKEGKKCGYYSETVDLQILFSDQVDYGRYKIFLKNSNGGNIKTFGEYKIADNLGTAFSINNKKYRVINLSLDISDVTTPIKSIYIEEWVDIGLTNTDKSAKEFLIENIYKTIYYNQSQNILNKINHNIDTDIYPYLIQQNFYTTSPTLNVKGILDEDNLSPEFVFYKKCLKIMWSLSDYNVGSTPIYDYQYSLKITDLSTGNSIKNIFGTTTGSQNTVITKIFTDETFLQYNSIKINLELRPKINGSYADSNSYAVSSEYTISKIEDINTVIKNYSFKDDMFRPFVTEIVDNIPNRISKVEKTFAIQGASSLGTTQFSLLEFPNSCQLCGNDESKITLNISYTSSPVNNPSQAIFTPSLDDQNILPITPTKIIIEIKNVYGDSAAIELIIPDSAIKKIEPIILLSKCITFAPAQYLQDKDSEEWYYSNLYTPTEGRIPIVNIEYVDNKFSGERIKYTIHKNLIYIPYEQCWASQIEDIKLNLQMFKYIDSKKEGSSFSSSGETYLLEHEESTETITMSSLFSGNWMNSMVHNLGKQTYFAHIGLIVSEDGKDNSASQKLYDQKTSYMSIQLGRVQPMQVDYCTFDGLKMIYRIIDNGGDRNSNYTYDTLTEQGQYESSLSRTGEEYLTLEFYDNQNTNLLSFDIGQKTGISLQTLRTYLLENRKLEIPLSFLINEDASAEQIKAILKGVRKIIGIYHISTSKEISFTFGDEEGETIYYKEIRPPFSIREQGIIVNGAPQEIITETEGKVDIVRIYAPQVNNKISLIYLNEADGTSLATATIYLDKENKIHLKGFVMDELEARITALEAYHG